jgi:predicted DNA-binding transcriptional regulator AlpA
MSKEHVPIDNASGSKQVPIEILTPRQLAERLQVKPSWIYEQTRHRSGVRNPDPLPHIKMGLYLRFDWRDVLAWLERQKRYLESSQTR